LLPGFTLKIADGQPPARADRAAAPAVAMVTPFHEDNHVRFGTVEFAVTWV
jgi:hypothetical protein